MEYGTKGKQQLPFVFSKQKTDQQTFVAADGNGKRMFVFLRWQTKTVIDDCCFSKPAHLCSQGRT
jgi:hypothetical protein